MKRRAFTIVELLVVLAAVACLLVVVPVVNGVFFRSRGCPNNLMRESANLAGLYKGMAVFGTSNKDHYPGLTPAGDYSTKPLEGKRYTAPANARDAAEAASGAGCDLSAGSRLAMAILLEEDSVSPVQLVSPGETNQTSAGPMADPMEVVPRSASAPVEVRDKHFSHALLAYGRPDLKREWRNDQNPRAVVLSTRLIFGKRADGFHSVWTDEDSGKWRGTVVRNDGSTEIELFAAQDLRGGGSPFIDLRYGEIACSPAACDATAVGIFGKSGNMAHFGASDKQGVVGSVHD